MAYDEDLADRVREQIGDEPGQTEQPMFGGLAFLLEGNMAVAVTRRAELMVRVGAEGEDDALGRPHTRLVEMRGRPMTGWIYVAPEGLLTDDDLGGWVRRGVAFARSLPPKR